MAEVISEISSLSKAITASERNRNDLLELVHYLQREEEDVLKAVIIALSQVYSHIITQDNHWLIPKPEVEGHCQGDVVEEYYCWLRDVYGACQGQLLCLLIHPQQSVACHALDLLLKMVAWEGHAHQSVTLAYSFPKMFHSVVSRLMDNTVGGKALIGQCAEVLTYHDVLFHWLKNIANLVCNRMDTNNGSSIPEHFVENVYSALQLVTMPTQDKALNNFLAGTPPKVQKSDSKRKPTSVVKAESLRVLQKYRKEFGSAWMAFLRLPLSQSMLKQVLVELHSAVMPHLLDPRLLLDFLSSSYDYGGVVSLLALNGLFILMNSYHLDYPSFYTQLYALLEPNLFHVKYTPRFFQLLNTFLNSTHLPLYLTAAFAKKLARLSLTAPPDGVVLAVVLVTNLTKRYPNCRVLLHRTNMEDCTLTSDPFDPNEPDPAECHALESCFWELKTLCEHYCPAVASLVKELLEPDSLLNPVETDLERQLHSSFNVVDFSVCGGEVALNYREPTSLW